VGHVSPAITKEIGIMGILEDLKKQAEETRKARQAEADRQMRLEQIYVSELRPRMLDIYRYLSELVEHIETIGIVVKAGYDFPTLGRVEPLEQKNYRFHIDNSDNPKRITLYFHCQTRREFLVPVDVQQADEARKFLEIQRIRCVDWPMRDPNGSIRQMLFQFVPKITVMLEFIADTDKSAIAIRAINFEELGVHDYSIKYENIDSAWLDQLGNYLLRKRDKLILIEEKPHDISEEEQQQLRDRINMEYQKLMMELELERTENTVEAGGFFRGLLKKLLGRKRPPH
jgi:hypothetical protein